MAQMKLKNIIQKIPVTHFIDEAKSFSNHLFHRAVDRHVKLAITGLSQSGKSAFITSLAHQLVHANAGSNLPFFQKANTANWLGAKVIESHSGLKSFPLEESLHLLCQDSPTCPASTRDISELRLLIRYRPTNFLERKLAPVANLYLDLVDYPGEWLLDMPMLSWTYQQWCQFTRQLCEKAPRKHLASSWRDLLVEMDPKTPYDSESLAKISRIYKEYLLKCRQEDAALSINQPGRFVLPGDLSDTSLLEFVPLVDHIPTDSEIESWPKASFYHTMAERYERYKKEIVEPFYRNHFRHFDRQIVLIDCLSVLNHGHSSFVDAQEAIRLILANFSYGQNSLLQRLFSPKIDKLLFAATKADCITPNQHHNLNQLIAAMVSQANNNAKFEGVQTETISLAAVKSTEVATAEFQGQKISCLKGKRRHDGEEVVLFPGQSPTEIPRAQDWQEERFKYIEFMPPQCSNGPSGITHIRIDHALEYLLGDKF